MKQNLLLRASVGTGAVFFILTLAGCNHAKVTPEEQAAAAPAGLSVGGLPPTIYVANFATNSTQVQVDPGGPLKRISSGEPLLQRQRGGLLGGLFNPHGDQQNPYQTSAQVSQVQSTSATDMTTDLVSALKKAGIPTTTALMYQPGTPNSLLLTGQFVTIDEGSQSKRMVIGLGVGAAYLETQMQLRDMSKPENNPMLTFHTTGNSGMAPGILVGGGVGKAVTGMAAVGAGVSGVRASRTGNGKDILQTAEQAAAYLKKYYQQQGWLPADPPPTTTTPPAPAAR